VPEGNPIFPRPINPTVAIGISPFSLAAYYATEKSTRVGPEGKEHRSEINNGAGSCPVQTTRTTPQLLWRERG